MQNNSIFVINWHCSHQVLIHGVAYEMAKGMKESKVGFMHWQVGGLEKLVKLVMMRIGSLHIAGSLIQSNF